MKNFFLISFLFFFISFIVFCSAEDDTPYNLYVNGDCGSEHEAECGDGTSSTKPVKSLKDAIGKANQDGTDNIFISIQSTESEYTENDNCGFTLSSKQWRISGGNTVATIPQITCGGKKNFLTIKSEQVTVTLVDLSVVNGTGANGGLISVSEKAHLNIQNCLFSESTATGFGGAIYVDDADLMITSAGDEFRTVFSRNSATSGGAIYVKDTSINIQGTTFLSNNADFGAAFYLANSKSTNNAFIAQSHFQNGRAKYYGAGLMVEASYNKFTLELTNFDTNIVDKDNGFAGGAIYVNTSSWVETNKCSFRSNSAPHGGAISVDSGVYHDLSSTFTANAGAADGGAISATSSSIFFNNTDFTLNTAANGFGGAIAHLTPPNAAPTTQDPTEIASCTFTQNTAALYGGAVYLKGQKRQVFVIGCNFHENAIFTGSDNSGGGALYGEKVQIIFKQIPTMFTNNTAYTHGGAVQLTNAPNTTFEQTIFSSNRAFGKGGAAYFTSDGGQEANFIYLDTVQFLDNNVGNTDGNANGGAVAIANIGLMASACSFMGNQADGKGGAIHSSSSADTFPHFLTNDFQQNTASDGSDAYLSGKSHGTFIDSTFKNAKGVTNTIPSISVAESANITFIYIQEVELSIPHLKIESEGDVNFESSVQTVLERATLSGEGTLYFRSASELSTVVSITESLDFEGGTFECGESSQQIVLEKKSTSIISDLKKKLKYISQCTFVNEGTLSIASSNELEDLILTKSASFQNEGDLLLTKDVTIGTVGLTPVSFSNSGDLVMVDLTLQSGSKTNFDLILYGSSKTTIDQSNATQAQLETQPIISVDGKATLDGKLVVDLSSHIPLKTSIDFISSSQVSGKFDSTKFERNGKSIGSKLHYGTNTTSFELVKSSSNNDDDGLSGGAIAGIVIGVICAVIIFGLFGYYVFQKKSNVDAPYESL